MKVLHVYKTFYPDSIGGVGTTINELALASKPFGIESQVLTVTQSKKTQSFMYNGYRVHQAKGLAKIASTDLSIEIFSLFSILLKDIDVVHYHYPWPLMDLMHLFAKVNKPSIVTHHSDIVKQKVLATLYAPLRKRFLNSVDQIVATSPNYLQTSAELKPYRHKTRVIPIGLAKENMPTVSRSLLERWRKNLPKRFFLFIGALRYYKGLHILLDALKLSEFPVVIVGAGSKETQLKKQAESHKLTTLHFLHEVSESDKAAILSLAYCMVFPSHLRSEAFGIALLEGAMYGKPMICAEIGTGTSYINVHQETGLVVEKNAPEQLANAMDEMWRFPDMAERMGLAAQQRYERLFTADNMATGYCQLYGEMLGRSG